MKLLKHEAEIRKGVKYFFIRKGNNELGMEGKFLFLSGGRRVVE